MATTEAPGADVALRRALIGFTAVNAGVFVYNLTRSVELAVVTMIVAPFLFRRSREQLLAPKGRVTEDRAVPVERAPEPPRHVPGTAPLRCALRWEDA